MGILTRTIILSIFLILAGCKAHKSRTVRFKTTIGISDINIRLKIPKGFREVALKRGNQLEKQFWYPDSSVIYVTANDVPVLNYENLRASGQYTKRQLSEDTLSLRGKGKNGLYWKDFKLKEGSIGYVNVSKSNLPIIDKSIRNATK